MTLGGLALAVGVLVDDATVTIENINFHLEQGKEIEQAIMDGARQIVVPATVSLLCICIVFVPMFSLGGVAGYLFRPLAEAVVFAMMGSYLLSAPWSRPWRPICSVGSRMMKELQHRAAIRWSVFSGALSTGSSDFGRAITLSLSSPWHCAGNSSSGFWAQSCCSFILVPFLGSNFFPSVDSGQIKLHLRAQTGTRIEETARLCDEVEQAVRRVIPPNELGNIVDNIGLPISGINMAYSNSGTIGVAEADILITLKPDHAPTDDYLTRYGNACPVCSRARLSPSSRQTSSPRS